MSQTCDANLSLHLLEVEITTRCNLRCKHCYSRTQNVVDMPLDRIVDLIQFAERHKVYSVVISGGEASHIRNLTNWPSCCCSENLKSEWWCKATAP